MRASRIRAHAAPSCEPLRYLLGCNAGNRRDAVYESGSRAVPRGSPTASGRPWGTDRAHTERAKERHAGTTNETHSGRKEASAPAPVFLPDGAGRIVCHQCAPDWFDGCALPESGGPGSVGQPAIAGCSHSAGDIAAARSRFVGYDSSRTLTRLYCPAGKRYGAGAIRSKECAGAGGAASSAYQEV